jgi:integrase
MTTDDIERCAIQIEPARSIKIVPGPNEKHLNDKQLADYKEHRWEFLQWLLREGKNEEKVKGYSEYTVYETGYKCARFDRWVWSEENRYTIPPTPEHADEYIADVVAYRDVTNSTKGKVEEALLRYFRWASQTSHVAEWDHEQRFLSGGDDAPRDYLTRRERRLVRESALNTGDSWKIPSIVMASLDAALRPVEVARAKREWVDIDNAVLRIPREDSSKNKDNWRAALTSRTATALDHWLDDRGEDPMYDDRDALWLTREATKYGSRSLSRLLSRLCDEAGIDERGRSMTWYAIRHSTGTHLTDERDLKAAKDQLRHKSPKTTMKYDNVDVATRRGALDNI